MEELIRLSPRKPHQTFNEKVALEMPFDIFISDTSQKRN